MSAELKSNNYRLLQIRGEWVRNPDQDQWGPANNPEWASGSGRVSTGLSVGVIQYRKYTLPLTWSKIPEEEARQIQSLIEDSDSAYFPIRFYHKCGYIDITVYASVVKPTGIYVVDGEVFYSKLTVTLVEK